MRGVNVQKLEPKELLDTRGWWRAERSMQGSEISRGAAARPVPSEVGTGWNARMRVGGRSVEMGAAKEEARMLIEQMPDHATWDDIMYHFYVKKKLTKALDEAAAGDIVPHETAKEQLSSK